MKQLPVRTAQNVALYYRPASIGDRILANIIDTVIVTALMISVLIIWQNLEFYHYGDTSFAIFFVLFMIPRVFYHLISEILLNGQSIGKRQRKIKIIRTDGTEPNVGNYFIRWLIRPVDMLFGGLVALVVISANERGQRIGDIASGTSVIKLTPYVSIEHILTNLQLSSDFYQVTYPEAAQLLPSSISYIERSLLDYRRSGNLYELRRLARNTRRDLGIEAQDKEHPAIFLGIIVQDYQHLQKMPETTEKVSY